ncbi:Dynein axonemal heavy chain 3 [Halotydeus destructor]|nr:Dynein axonemal heavy chain 3 [Halotydeus destructor]
MSGENDVILYERDKSSNTGTRFIPLFDAFSNLSVFTIGSYLAPESYRNVCDSVYSRDITVHKEVLDKYRHLLTRDPKPDLCPSPARSPEKQRQLFLTGHQLVTRLEVDELDIERLMDAIDGTLVPQDKLLGSAFERAISRLPATLFKDKQRYQQLADQFVSEAKENYVQAVKRTIVEYIALSRAERKRLGIVLVEPFPGKHQLIGSFLIRSPVAWHDQMSVARQQIVSTNFSLMPLIDKIRRLWYSRFASLSIFDNIVFPVDVQYFRSQVTINCELIRCTLNYAWISEVVELFVKERQSIKIDLTPNGKDYHLFETIAVFMGRLLRQLIVDNIEHWTNVASPSSGSGQKELFIARAWFSTGYTCEIDPKPSDWPRIVVHPINEVLKATSSVPRIERQLLLSELGQVGNAFKFVTSVREDDYEIMSLKRQLLKLVNKSDSDTIMRQADNKIVRLQNLKRTSKLNIYDLSQLRSLIREQEQFEDDSVYETNFNWVAGIMLVNYSELRRRLISEAREARDQLIRSRVEDTIAIGQRVCEQFRRMRAKIEQVTGTTKDVVENTKLLNHCRGLTRLLFKDIEFFQDHWTFFTEEGAQFMSDSHFELCHKLYHWPAAIRATFAQCDEKLALAKVEIENKLRLRTTKFEVELDDIEKKLVAFKKKKLSSPLEKTSDNLRILADIQAEINAAIKLKEQINYEEGLLGWHSLSKLQQLEENALMKRPLDMLWKSWQDFDRKSKVWLAFRVNELDIVQMSKEIDAMLGNVEEMSIAQSVSKLAGDEDVKGNIGILEAHIDEFRKVQLPLLSVVTLPVLRDRHWRQMSDLLNHRVSASSVVTLADVVQSAEAYDPAVVAKIVQLGKTATREHALEVFLARMKNEWISDEWPADALDIAANKFLEEEVMDEHLKNLCASAFKFIHDTAREYVGQRASGFLFPIKVTPPLFIELILTFKELLKKKQSAISSQKFRYAAGIDKLHLASTFVKDMKRKVITEYEPQLFATSRETEKLMIHIETETYDIELAKEKIASDENQANRAAALAQQIRDECTKELAEAVPAMESAIRALDTLNAEDITFLRTMKNPPLGVKMVLEAVAILLGFGAERRLNANGMWAEDYWASALRMLNSCDLKLLDALKTYDKDHVKPMNIKLVRLNYLIFDDFDPVALKPISAACESIAKWVKALDIYDRVINVIKPKKMKLLEAEKDLTTLMDGVLLMKKQLQEVTDRLQGLSDEFASISKTKRELEDNINLCEQRVQRAEKLIVGLDSERERWGKAAVGLGDQELTIVGDNMLAAAFVVYLSPMGPDDRLELVRQWQEYMDNIPEMKYQAPFRLVKIAGAPMDIQTWILAGMNTDTFSLDNATIVMNSKRFPLIIDPSGTASDWISRMYRYRGLTIVTEEDDIEGAMMTQIKKNLGRGKPVLVLDVDMQKFTSTFFGNLLIKDILNEDGVTTIVIGEEVLEYDKNFNLFMTRKEYIDVPLTIYGRLCFVNWDMSTCRDQQRIVSVDDTIKYKERAKKEKHLLELEDLLLESLSSDEVIT